MDTAEDQLISAYNEDDAPHVDDLAIAAAAAAQSELDAAIALHPELPIAAPRQQPSLSSSPAPTSSSSSSSSDDDEDEDEEGEHDLKSDYWKNKLNAAYGLTLTDDDSPSPSRSSSPSPSPPRTKNEVPLPPPERLLIELLPTDTLVPIGKVTGVIEGMIVIQSVKNKRPLNDGSLLVLEDKSVLGKVEEVFGPVLSPMYALRYAGPETVPPKLESGRIVCAVERLSEFLVPESLYSKGYDASGKDDEEVVEEAEFSDDEKEAAFKRDKKKKKDKPRPNKPSYSMPPRQNQNQQAALWQQQQQQQGMMSYPYPPQHQHQQQQHPMMQPIPPSYMQMAGMAGYAMPSHLPPNPYHMMGFNPYNNVPPPQPPPGPPPAANQPQNPSQVHGAAADFFRGKKQ